MAGSIQHTIGKDGKFTMQLIENLGDAHEALEEYFDAYGRLVKLFEEVEAARREQNPYSRVIFRRITTEIMGARKIRKQARDAWEKDDG